MQVTTSCSGCAPAPQRSSTCATSPLQPGEDEGRTPPLPQNADQRTPYNIDEVDPGGARYRQTSHDDVRFVGQVSELMA